MLRIFTNRQAPKHQQADQHDQQTPDDTDDRAANGEIGKDHDERGKGRLFNHTIQQWRTQFGAQRDEFQGTTGGHVDGAHAGRDDLAPFVQGRAIGRGDRRPRRLS